MCRSSDHGGHECPKLEVCDSDRQREDLKALVSVPSTKPPKIKSGVDHVVPPIAEPPREVEKKSKGGRPKQFDDPVARRREKQRELMRKRRAKNKDVQS